MAKIHCTLENAALLINGVKFIPHPEGDGLISEDHVEDPHLSIFTSINGYKILDEPEAEPVADPEPVSDDEPDGDDEPQTATAPTAAPAVETAAERKARLKREARAEAKARAAAATETPAAGNGDDAASA